jgi:hypothetical protein
VGLRELMDKLIGRSKPTEPPPAEPSLVPTQPTPEDIAEVEREKEALEKDAEQGESGGAS